MMSPLYYSVQQSDYVARYQASIAAENTRQYTIKMIQEKSTTIQKFLLTKKQMYDNGYPVEIFNNVYIHANEYQQNRRMYFEMSDTTRVCTRCCSVFKVENNGFQRLSRGPICKDSDGIFYNFHVHDQQPSENLKKFKRAPKANEFNDYMSGQIFALDVELVYTSHGQAVGRVTVVDYQGTTVVDAIVRPQNQIYDPVTKYSGLTMDHFNYATETVESVREKIFDYINEDSILIGHGLYGDLKALGIIHSNVIDTSVLYTNNGKRPSLRHLASTHLKYDIQNRGSMGHCSREDAIASLHLVFFGAIHPDMLAPFYRNCCIIL